MCLVLVPWTNTNNYSASEMKPKPYRAPLAHITNLAGWAVKDRNFFSEEAHCSKKSTPLENGGVKVRVSVTGKQRHSTAVPLRVPSGTFGYHKRQLLS